MKNRFEEFLSLHQGIDVLQIANVWDARSAVACHAAGYKAIGTSSAAVASSLGFEDGQQMSFDDYLFIIRRVLAATPAIVTVDLEAGYADTPEEICNNVARLYETGVAGINIEDSIIVNGKRTITDAAIFSQKLQQLMTCLHKRNISVFINVRTDSFLLNLHNAAEDALERAAIYQKTGVHGLFFPCITRIADINKITAVSQLPVNVMCMTGLPGFDELQKAGVKRISTGPFLHTKVFNELATSLSTIRTERNFACLF